jgi:hypothetical protein
MGGASQPSEPQRLLHVLDRLGDDLFGFSAPGPASGERWSVRYLLMAASLALVMMARRPDAIFRAQFWADDNMFFVQQLTLGFCSALRQLYGGFPYLVHRMIAGLAAFLPIAWAPLAYNVSAIAITALTMATFCLPGFRHLVRDDRLRAACCLAILCIPSSQELLATLTCVGFFLAIWLVFLAVMRVPGTTVGVAGCCLGGAFAIFSTPLATVAAPLWVLRVVGGWHRRRGRDIAFAVSHIVILLVVLAMVGTGSAGTLTTRSGEASTIVWRNDYLWSAVGWLAWVTAAQIDAALLPPAAFGHAEALGGLAVAVPALLVILCFGFVARDLPERGRVTLGLAIYLLVSSLYLVLAGRPATVLLLRGELLPELKLRTFQIIGWRHRALANVAILLAVAALLDGARRLRSRVAALVACTGLLLAWGPEFPVPAFPDLRWPMWAARIEHHLASARSGPLVVPSHPPTYEIHLDGTPGGD